MRKYYNSTIELPIRVKTFILDQLYISHYEISIISCTSLNMHSNISIMKLLAFVKILQSLLYIDNYNYKLYYYTYMCSVNFVQH